MTRFSFLFLVGCAQPPLPDAGWYACTSPERAPHPNAAAYQALVDEPLAAGSVAVSAAVVDADGLWVSAGGYADLVQEIEAEPCHRFYMASVTKMFAAATALRLAEDGVWSLDDLARAYLPGEVNENIANLDLTDPAEGVTLRHLLQHTSGIPDYLAMPYYLEAFNGGLQGGDAAEELVWSYGRDPLFAPGDGIEYANANYLLLALAVQQATGKTAYAAVHEQVTEPLGLHDTLGRSEGPSAVVRGYADMRGGGHVMDHTALTESVMLGADKLDGGLVSTAADVATLLRAFSEGQLLQPGSFGEMASFRDYPPSDEEVLETGYGLGLARVETEYGVGWGHYGGVYPFQSAAFHFPEHDRTVVVAVSGFTDAVTTWIGETGIFDAALRP